MAQLEHLFVNGLRFDTEIQYQVRSANQLSYENLPIHQSASARTCALASLVQCVAVLGQVPAKDARELMRVAQRALNRSLPRGRESAPDEVDDETLLHVFDALCTPTAELHLASCPAKHNRAGTARLCFIFGRHSYASVNLQRRLVQIERFQALKPSNFGTDMLPNGTVMPPIGTVMLPRVETWCSARNFLRKERA